MKTSPAGTNTFGAAGAAVSAFGAAAVAVAAGCACADGVKFSISLFTIRPFSPEPLT